MSVLWVSEEQKDDPALDWTEHEGLLGGFMTNLERTVAVVGDLKARIHVSIRWPAKGPSQRC